MAAPAHPATHHGRTHHHPNYLMIFWWLAILTVLEVGVIFMPIPKMTINVLLGAFALVKAALVAAYFMHLRFEVRTLGLIAVTPLAIAILLIFVILPDSFAIIKQTDKKKPAEAATAPAHRCAAFDAPGRGAWSRRGRARGGPDGRSQRAEARGQSPGGGGAGPTRAGLRRCPRCGGTRLFPGWGFRAGSRWRRAAPGAGCTSSAPRATGWARSTSTMR